MTPTTRIAPARRPRFLEPGGHTAHGGTLDYRLGKLVDRGIVRGHWLDVGCAQGYWSIALAKRGARSVVGIEQNPLLVENAAALGAPEGVAFQTGTAEHLPFPDGTFDGVLINEVLEHVADEIAALRACRKTTW